MEDSVEHISSKEMLEKIAELGFSQSHLRDLNGQMRLWLDSADEEMTVLRSENGALGKQVKALENIIKDAQQDEAEPCWSPRMDDIDAKRLHKEKIQKLNDSNEMKEENEKLTEQVRGLEEQREQDKIALSKLNVALFTVERGMVEAQVEVQHRDELIEQTRSRLKQAEGTVQECFNIIEDLRETNQQLRQQLEEKQEEISLAHFSDIMKETEGPKSPPLSFAEEIKLLLPSTPADQEKEQTVPATVPESSRRCKHSITQKVGLYTWHAFVLAALAFVIVVFVVGISNVFSLKSLWSRVQLMLQPYCTLHHLALPPI